MIDLQQLYADVRACTKCPLAKGRTNAVPGEGPSTAEIVFVGEAPGFHEDRTGRPFVGAAGQFLNELLGSIGLSRKDVYICNVIKCRPPQNRDPMPNELDACSEWLTKQFAFLKPKVVVTLGRFSMNHYFPGETISRIHGQPKLVNGVYYLPMFHPAAALHQPKYRALIEADFKQIPQLLQKARASGAARPESDAEGILSSSTSAAPGEPPVRATREQPAPLIVSTQPAPPAPASEPEQPPAPPRQLPLF